MFDVSYNKKFYGCYNTCHNAIVIFLKSVPPACYNCVKVYEILITMYMNFVFKCYTKSHAVCLNDFMKCKKEKRLEENESKIISK